MYKSEQNEKILLLQQTRRGRTGLSIVMFCCRSLTKFIPTGKKKKNMSLIGL